MTSGGSRGGNAVLAPRSTDEFNKSLVTSWRRGVMPDIDQSTSVIDVKPLKNKDSNEEL